MDHSKALYIANKFINTNILKQFISLLKLHSSLFLNESYLYIFTWLPEVNNVSIPQAEVCVTIDTLSGEVIG